MSDKHVWNIGRWRVAWRLGHYRMGFHRKTVGAYTGALPFIWVSVLRRNRVPRQPVVGSGE